MTARVFVDTNVLVYARDAAYPTRQAAAAAWMERLWADRIGRLSYQVLHEFYVTVTRKLQPGMEHAAARAEVRALLAWQPVGGGGSLLEEAWRLEDDHSLSWWDALIVAAAQAARCPYLLSEDLQDGGRYGEVTVVNPFRVGPDDLLGQGAA